MLLLPKKVTVLPDLIRHSSEDGGSTPREAVRVVGGIATGILAMMVVSGV